MYCKFFGLRCRPFDDRPDPQFLFSTPDEEEVLGALRYEAQYGKGGVLLLGEAGTGKTLLLRTLLQRIDGSAAVVFLTWPTGGNTDIVRETARGLGVSLPHAATEDRCHVRLRRQLGRRAASHPAVLVVDQSENLSVKSMSQVAALTELEHGGRPLIRLVLAGQLPLHHVLQDSRFARLAQRLGRPQRVKALTRPQTQGYVAHRLRVAGATNPGLFDDEAIERIYARSKGIPRLIMHLCDACLLAACADQSRRVSREIAEDVTLNACSQEWSVPARDVGVPSAAHVAAGLPGQAAKTTALAGSVYVPVGVTVASGPGFDPATPATETYSQEEGNDTPKDRRQEAEDGFDRRDRPDEKPASVEGIDFPLHRRGVRIADERQLLHRLKAVVARAHRMDSTTAASLRRATAAERQLATLSTAAERLVATLAEAVQRSDGSADHVAERLNDLLAEAERRAQGLEDRVSEALRQSSEVMQHVASVEHAGQQAGSVESRMRSLADDLANKGEHAEQRIQLLLKAAQNARDFHDKLAKSTERAAAAKHAAEQCTATIQEELEGAVQRTSQVQSKLIDEALRAVDQKVDERLRQWERTASEKIVAAQQCIDRLGNQAEAARTQADEWLTRVQQTCRDMEVKQAEASATLREIGQSLELVTAAREQLAVCVEAEKRLQAGREAAETVAAQVEAVTGAAGQVLPRLEKKAVDAAELVGRLTAQQASGSQLLSDLHSAQERAREEAVRVHKTCRSALGRLRMASQRGEKAADAAAKQVSKLTALTAAGEQSAVRLEELTSATQQVQESVQSLVGHADERATRLASQNATSARVLQELSQTTSDVQPLVDKLNAERRIAQETLAKMTDQSDQIVQRMTALFSDAENRYAKLEAGNTTAKELAELLNTATPEGRRCITQIEELRDQLVQLAATLQERCTHAERIGERIATLTPLIQFLEEKEPSLVRLNEEAQSNHAQLVEVIAVGRERGAALHQVCDSVQGLVGGAMHVKGEMERVCQMASEQIGATRHSVEAGETLIRGYQAQCGAVQERLGVLQNETSRIEQGLNAATERPAKLLASAESQAAQLAQVCAAVRKVFSAVSKATLEARSTSAACVQASQRAAQRMSQLRAQTDRAGSILHEWIEEASCAQARLERTLRASPTIRETHSAATLQVESAPVGTATGMASPREPARSA